MAAPSKRFLVKMAAVNINKPRVEIGILEECDQFLLESRFFPSKFGGKPAWLDLKNLPDELSCKNCSNPCIFLCQLYAPIDHAPQCFHRTIYLFVCTNPDCCRTNDNKNFKVLRCQLSCENNFYPVAEPEQKMEWHPECIVENFSKICALCGNPGPYNCGKCKTVSYCSKEHQITDWKRYGHKVNCGNDAKEKQIEVPFLFPELEITIDHAPDDDEEVEEENEKKAMEEYEKLAAEKGTGTLPDSNMEELEKYAVVKTDKYFSNYKEWIAKCPDQVVRYCRGGEPLFVAKPECSGPNVPKCEYCGGNRRFEFQVFSTLLNEVMEFESFNHLDWGTLIVYTCENDCQEGPSYKNEYLYKQDFVD